MTIEEHAEDGDEIIETGGVRLVVDNFSAMYLSGAEVDYVNSLMGGGFTVRNPNAVAGAPAGTRSTPAAMSKPRTAAAAALAHSRSDGDRSAVSVDDSPIRPSQLQTAVKLRRMTAFPIRGLCD